MSKILKLVIFLFFYSQYLNASDCSLAHYRGESECVKEVYLEINKRIDKVYKELAIALQKNDSIKFAKEYDLWLNQKNRVCDKYSSDDLELKTCHINFNIPKLNELWDMELKTEMIKNKFEGNWIYCYEDKRELHCTYRFLVQQGDNICGTWQWVNINNRYDSGKALYRSKDGKVADSVKACSDGTLDSFYRCEIYIKNFEDNKSPSYNLEIDFLDWEESDNEGTAAEQMFIKRPFKTSIKTQFLSGEREALIETNKWLQDCLNYKGE
ncbi:MAG: hypothetical protein LBJ88_05420 [Campylobacteraceae bacterium]|nr:hypothetical protein [Campylobacteraceae bacterium]